MVQKNQASIVIRDLSKRYRSNQAYALKNLSLSVMPGEVYGFLGPNGAGKSTTIRLLMNFIQPSGGSASILGKDIVKESVEVKKTAGYLAGDFAIYPKMTGRQYISYLSELQKPVKGYTEKLSKLLNAELDKKLGDLSRGNRQKIGIMQAFMHQPQILILDEPTSGLDPLMQEVFHKLIKESKQRGASVFVSSHIMGEVQKTCDRVGIIRAGKLVSEENISQLAKKAAQTFDIIFSDKAPVSELKKIKGVRIERQENNQVTLHINGKLGPLFSVLARHDVVNIDARNLDLEDMFMKFYQGENKK
jgi:ABC-2 type transport system ATP-binding protein